MFTPKTKAKINPNIKINKKSKVTAIPSMRTDLGISSLDLNSEYKNTKHRINNTDINSRIIIFSFIQNIIASPNPKFQV